MGNAATSKKGDPAENGKKSKCLSMKHYFMSQCIKSINTRVISTCNLHGIDCFQVELIFFHVFDFASCINNFPFRLRPKL